MKEAEDNKMGIGVAIGVSAVLVLIVLPLVIVIVLQRKAIAPYVAIGRAFRTGGIPAMAATARNYLPTLQRDLALLTTPQ